MSFAAVRNVLRTQGSSRLLRLALFRRGYADESGTGNLSLTFGTPSQVGEDIYFINLMPCR